MRRRTRNRIVGACATIGFLVPVVLLASYAAADRIPGNELLWLCPGSFASIAVQHATTAATLAVWTLICLSNAILYGLVGLMVCLPFLWRDRA